MKKEAKDSEQRSAKVSTVASSSKKNLVTAER